MRKRWLLILSCATLLAIIYSARSVFITISQGRTIDWVRLIVFEFQYWYVWAVLTPLILWFARRFELQRTNWRRTLLALIVFGLIIAPFQATVEYLIAFGFDIWRGMSQEEIMRRTQVIKRAIVVEAFSNFIIYSLIVCGHYAYEYYRRYRERELRSVELEGRLAQAELQNLKMQLHPHFLFNTLNSISVLMMRDVELAHRMLIRLSDLLRITLDSAGTQMVSLKQELDFLRGYLEIEQTRFQDRLTVHFDVSTAALFGQVPNLILQPLVENAIRHGITTRPGAGVIQINASVENQHLQMQVSDDGPGLDDKFKKGIGLANTEARLKQLYGTAHKFELQNQPTGGLLVTITIPYDDR